MFTDGDHKDYNNGLVCLSKFGVIWSLCKSWIQTGAGAKCRSGKGEELA